MQVLGIANRCNRDYMGSLKDLKLGQKDHKSGQGFEVGGKDFKSGQRLQIGVREIKNRSRDFKLGQGLQIGTEHVKQRIYGSSNVNLSCANKCVNFLNFKLT